MEENINTNSVEMHLYKQENIHEDVLQDITLCDYSVLQNKNVLSVPIAELSTLGAGVSSLIPGLNKATQTLSFSTDGLYTLANANAGDVLKASQHGNYWGALKTASGKSKMAQLKDANSISAVSEIKSINPSTMLMAVALYSIEKELKKMENTQNKIFSFIEIEKEAEIKADVETLMSTVKKYKQNWNNENYVDSNYKMVLDIQRTARKNMYGYQQSVIEIIDKKQLFVNFSNVQISLEDLKKKFMYYRLSLYSFSLASLMEILLGKNYKEEYIDSIKTEIKEMTDSYRELFSKSSCYIEKISNSSLEANVAKGVGFAGKSLGKFIGNISMAKEKNVDELVQNGSAYLENNVLATKEKLVREFEPLSNPETKVFINKMDVLIQIYNHTNQICFDKENIYLVD